MCENERERERERGVCVCDCERDNGIGLLASCTCPGVCVRARALVCRYVCDSRTGHASLNVCMHVCVCLFTHTLEVCISGPCM